MTPEGADFGPARARPGERLLAIAHLAWKSSFILADSIIRMGRRSELSTNPPKHKQATGPGRRCQRRRCGRRGSERITPVRPRVTPPFGARSEHHAGQCGHQLPLRRRASRSRDESRAGNISTHPPSRGPVVRPRCSQRLPGKHCRHIHFNCHIGPRQLTNDEKSRCRNRSAAEGLSTAFQCVLKKANIRRVGHYSYNIVHRRPLQVEQLLDFHVRIPALLHEIALVNDFSVTLTFWSNSSKKDELSRICNSHHFREFSLGPFVVIEVLFLEARCALSNGKRV